MPDTLGWNAGSSLLNLTVKPIFHPFVVVVFPFSPLSKSISHHVGYVSTPDVLRIYTHTFMSKHLLYSWKYLSEATPETQE